VHRSRGELARVAGFGLITVAFAVSQPFVLVGLPLALLLIAYGPRNVPAALILGAVLTGAALGERAGLWWFERGWPLLLGGTFVWVAGWWPNWRFTGQALAAVWVAAAVAALVFVVSPGAWLDVDSLVAARANQAAESAAQLLGERADGAVRALMQRVVSLQVSLFPALLGVSSLGALGLAVTIRGWLAGGSQGAFGQLRRFRFNDHLVWVWLAGLVLVLAPIGDIADRVGSNAVLFMGALYVVRGLAVLLSLVGGISLVAGILGGLVALLLYPILALLVVAMFVVGLGDTWLNVRARIQARNDRRSSGNG
jgi:hypothetical protein